MYWTLFCREHTFSLRQRVTPIIALLLLNREWEVNNTEVSQLLVLELTEAAVESFILKEQPSKFREPGKKIPFFTISFKRKVSKYDLTSTRGYCIETMMVILFKRVSVIHFPRQINLRIL